MVEQRDERPHSLRCVEEEVGARPRGIRATPRFGHVSSDRVQCCCSPGPVYSYLLPPLAKPPPSDARVCDISRFARRDICSRIIVLHPGEVHGRQSTVRDPGSTVHGPRSTLHGPRSTVPSTRGECVAAPANTQPFVPAADGSRLSHCRRVAVSPCRRVAGKPGRHRRPAAIAPSRPQITRF